MKTNHLTENPARAYKKASTNAKNLAGLITAIKEYKRVAPDAFVKAKQMTNADFTIFKKDLPKFKNATGKIAEELAIIPKMQKAFLDMLAPLKQPGDSIKISAGDESIKIDYESNP